MNKSAPKTGIIKVGEQEFSWTVFRQPTWVNTGGYALLGLAILVQLKEGRTRELLLEFDIDPTKHGDMPQHQRFKVSPRRLIECIEAAIAAGWEPESRGKRFIIQAGSVNSV